MQLSPTLRGMAAAESADVHHIVLWYVHRRTLLAQVSSRTAAEEALLSAFDTGRKMDEAATIKRGQFQVWQILSAISEVYSVGHCRSHLL